MTRLPDLVILTEGDWARGLGHLGRCLGYARHWRLVGRQVLWIVDGDEAARRFLEGETVIWRQWQDDGDIPEVAGELRRLSISTTSNWTTIRRASWFTARRDRWTGPAAAPNG